MARQIRWTHEALADVEAIAEYIAKDSPFYAAAFVEEILEAAASLMDFPSRGRHVPEMGRPDVRELFVKGYRLIYRDREEAVTILTVVHGRRYLSGLPGGGGRETPG